MRLHTVQNIMKRAHSSKLVCKYTKISFNTVSMQFNKIFILQS